MTINAAGTDGHWEGGAPVFGTSFEYEWGGRRWTYPDVWLSVQKEDPTPGHTGRTCVGHYTPDVDPTGEMALRYADRYYREGISCASEELHGRRISCFQAAELLCLHATAAGNPFAHLLLGRMYEHDLCEGGYWDRAMSWDLSDDLLTPFPCERKAYEHYLQAAQADIPEACRALGDLLLNGRGCEADARRASFWHERARDLEARG